MQTEALQTRPDAAAQAAAEIRTLASRWPILTVHDAARLVALLDGATLAGAAVNVDPAVLRAVHALALGDPHPRDRLYRVAGNLPAFTNAADAIAPLTVR